MGKFIFWAWFFVIITLFSSMVIASDFYFKKGTTIDLKIGCYNDGKNCGSNIICNLTTIYPNSSVLVNNQVMSRTQSYYSYNFPSINITGEYNNYMVCYNNTDSSFTLFNFEVNNKGNNEQPTLMNALLIVVPLILGIICVFATFSLGEDHPMLKLFLLLFGLCTFFMSIGMAILNIGYYNTYTELIDSLGLWVYVFGSIYFFILLYFIIYLLYKIFNMMREDKDRKLNY